jgi:hypothetical protein
MRASEVALKRATFGPKLNAVTPYSLQCRIWPWLHEVVSMKLRCIGVLYRACRHYERSEWVLTRPNQRVQRGQKQGQTRLLLFVNKNTFLTSIHRLLQTSAGVVEWRQ